MKRYRLPAELEPGMIPARLAEHPVNPLDTHAYMALHWLALSRQDRGPFTAEQLLLLIPPVDPPLSLPPLAASLRRLAERGFIEVELLS